MDNQAESSSVCVRIEGLSIDKLAERWLKTYFEDEDRSGGGIIQNSVYSTGEYTAIICFADSEARSRVLAKNDHRIQIPGKGTVSLDVTRCSPHLEQKCFSVHTSPSIASVDSVNEERLFKQTMQEFIEKRIRDKNAVTEACDSLPASQPKEDNADSNTFLRFSEGLIRFVKKHMNQEFESICQSLGGKLEIKAVSHENILDLVHGIQLEGNLTAINAAKDKVKELIDRIHERQLTITKPGIKDKLLLTERASQFFHSLEASMKVTIDLVDEATYEPQPEKTAVVVDGTLMMVQTDFQSYKTDAIVKGELPEGEGLAGAVEAGTSKVTTPFKRNGKNRITTVDGRLNVTIVSGSIEQQQVDAIVNTTSRGFVLNMGAVSAAIARAAGPSLQHELTAAVTKRIQPGEIVVTSGGNLPCSKVYHGQLEKWDGPNGQAPKVLRSFVKACLTQAAAESKTSLALPPLGTGYHSSPPDTVFEIMLEEIAIFSKENLTTTLKEIFIVVYYKDSAKFSVCENVLDSFASDYELVSRHPNYKQKSSTDPFSISVLESEFVSRPSINLGPVQLFIHQGDIMRESTEAIVRCTNGRQDIHDEMLKATEQTLAQESKTIGLLPMKRGSSPSAWRTMVKRALTEADKQGLTSIAFPAFGGGSCSESAAVVADAMFEGLALFVAKNKPESLREVIFTIVQPEMLQTFIDTLKVKVNQRTEPTLLQCVIGSLPQLNRSNIKTLETPIAATFVKPDFKSVLVIRGLSQCTIDHAVERIEHFCEDERDIVLYDREPNAVIEKLFKQQVEDIQSLSRDYDVEITVERSEGMRCIRVAGERDGATKGLQVVLEKLQEVQKEAASLIANQLRWEFREEDGTFSQYPPELNMTIENAFSEQQQSYQWTEENTTFQINFGDKMEKIIGQADSDIEVRRKVLGQNQLPPIWEKMAPGEPFKLVRLSTLAMEFYGVAGDFWQSGGDRSIDIVRIDRVQNPTLLIRYQDRCAQMEKANPNSQFERMLWHGIAAHALPNINAGGLKRTYSKNNATSLGYGVYFARNSSYFAQSAYSPADEHGHKHMYYCRVLTGKYTRGQSGLREPPEKDPQKPGDRYDCVVDNTSNPGIFVIFSDIQVYPEYLITFK